jgi:hypothetical protein
VQSIHSATVLTRGERRHRTHQPPSDDESPRLFAQSELEACLKAPLRRARELALAYQQQSHLLSSEREPILAEIEATTRRIEDSVTRFNAADDALRAAAWQELRARLQTRHRMSRRLARLERPLAELAFHYRSVLEDARAQLEQRATTRRSTAGVMTLPPRATDSSALSRT